MRTPIQLLKLLLDGASPETLRDELAQLDDTADLLGKMNLLLQVAVHAAGAPSLAGLLDRLADTIRRVVQAERATLFLNDPRTAELFSKSMAGGQSGEIRFPNTAGIAGSVFRTGEPVIIPDAYADPRFNPAVDRKTGFRTRNIICAPIRNREGSLIGVAQALNHTGAGFTESELTILDLATTQAAAALADAQLREDLEAARREEAMLQEISRALSSELNLETLLEQVTAAMSNLLQADRSSVFLKDRKKDELYSFVAQGTNHAEIRFPSHVGIAGAVFASGEPVNLADAYEDPRFNQAIDRKTGYRTKSLLTMPIRNRAGRIVGVTQVINKKDGGAFTPADERKQLAFTGHIAVALENAALFHEVEAMRNYNESILESMSNAVITVDDDGRIKKCNAAFCRIFRCPVERWAGLPSSALFTGANAWIEERVQRATRTGKTDISMDCTVPLPDGDAINANVTIVPLRTQKQEPLGALVVVEDMTTERRVKSMMARYMAKEVAERLLESEDNALGGKSQLVSVLFSDIRQFTTLSERLGPRETVSALNEYFTAMVDRVLTEGGILDKFIGDAIMASFGVPFEKADDADRAVRCGIAMLCALEQLNKGRAAAGRPEIAIGIGINSDEVISGNIGSLKRMDYTVIGDGVNLASRLEGLCKLYHAQLLITEYTQQRLEGEYLLRPVDWVVVKGKHAPVRVFEVLDYRSDRPAGELTDLSTRFARALDDYRARRWDEAITTLEQLAHDFPEDGLAHIYLDRCRQFRETPPPEHWDGVWVWTTK